MTAMAVPAKSKRTKTKLTLVMTVHSLPEPAAGRGLLFGSGAKIGPYENIVPEIVFKLFKYYT
jgi:hypothetical protein